MIKIFKLSEGDFTGRGVEINAEDLVGRGVEDTCIACACSVFALNDVGAIAGPEAIDLHTDRASAVE